jgi:hypothetical protein
MLKVKCYSVKLKSLVPEFGEQYFSTDMEIIFCKLHAVEVVAEKCFTVQQHSSTTKPKNNLSQHTTQGQQKKLV